jgi:hypothetical protein
MTADEHFLSRWSRLKKDARQGEDAPGPNVEAREPLAPPAAPAREPNATQAVAAPVPAPELPSIESLKGLASEYTEFLKPGVDDGLRRAALKKLFADPYFETFEKFEAYCEDYTQFEPIPPAMLRTLEHAKGLLFDEKEEKKEEETKEGAGDAVASEEPRFDAPAPSEAKTETPQPQSEQKT